MSELPQDFISRIANERQDAQALFDALSDEAPISIRLNPNKLTDAFDNSAVVPWCDFGRYLSERPSFTKDPLFHAGAYYPQEAGSMFIHAVLQQLELDDQTVALDLCAAPGGKSTILLDNLSKNSLLISNEIVRNRAFILRDTLSKWGASNVMVTNKAPQDFSPLTGLFDLVLVDAPCSGEGMFRKDLAARNEWSLANAENCAVRQTDILEAIWPSMKTGAHLLYSTCTFNPEENDKQIQNLLEHYDCELVELHFPPEFGLEKSNFGYACLPHLMRSEGFYFAVLRKTENCKDFTMRKPKKQKIAENDFPFQLDDAFTVTEIQGYMHMLPAAQAELMLHLNERLGCMKLGTRLGEIVKGKLNPHFEWALCQHAPTEFSSTELALSEALQYLKGNSFELEGADGWHLARYENKALGWFKKIGNRINNYYPKELRIRMEV